MSVIAPDFPHHWKTTLLEQELGDPNAGMHVVRLWLHCHARMEDTFEMTAEQLAAVCKYRVKEGEKLEAALISCRWLRRDGAKLTVIGWREYNARLFSNRANGSRGGRPRKPTGNPSATDGEPMGNPSETHGLPMGNRSKTEWSGVEGSRADNHLTGASQRESVVFSIQTDLCTLFSRKKTRLGAEATRALQELADEGALPLSDADWSALCRFYQERKNDPGAKDAHWRVSADAVAMHLLAEIDKAKVWLEKHGLAVSAQPAPAADPTGWREWLDAKGYPAVPFANADGTLRREFREKERGSEAA